MASIAERLIQGAQQQASTSLDIGESFTQGAQIGLRMEQARQNREKLEQQKQQMQLKKLGSFVDSIAKIDKTDDPKTKQWLQKHFVPKQAKALGIPIDPENVQFFTTEENRAKISAIQVMFERGDLQVPDLVGFVSDPGKLVDFEIPADLRAQAAEAAQAGISKFLGRQSQERASGFKQEREDQRRKEVFDKVAREGSKRVATAFKPLKDAKDGVRLGRKSLDTLLADAKAGRPLNENLFNTAARGIAKAFNKGAMTEQDVADFKELQGFAGKSEAVYRKWIAGGVNIDVVKNLVKVTEITSKILDRRARDTAKEMEGSFVTTAFPGREAELRKASGIDEALAPTLNKSKEVPPKKPAPFPAYPKVTKEVFESWKSIKGKQEKFAKQLGLTLDQVKTALGVK